MIILGSSSPRRIELLKTIVKHFKVVKPPFDEHTISEKTDKRALLEANCKAMSLKDTLSDDDLLICCDTIVCYENQVFEKPVDEQDAFRILKALSNNTHYVVTAYVIIYKDKKIEKEVKSFVTFNKLSDEFIAYYIKNGNVMDKAGSYAVQDNDKYHLISEIKGSVTNVIGFPIDEIKSDLVSLGFCKD